MTFTNEILNAHDVKVLELSHFQRAALGDLAEILSVTSQKVSPNQARSGQMRVRMYHERSEMLVELSLLGSQNKAYVSTKMSNSRLSRFEACSYVGVGRFQAGAIPTHLGVGPTMVGASTNGDHGNWFLHESRDQVLQLNLDEYPIGKAVQATIDQDHFRNLLNKLGKSEEFLRLFVKDNTLAGVTSVDNDTANCVTSHYKARDVMIADGAEECSATVNYSSLYQFLYRRKVGKIGLLQRDAFSSRGEMNFGILDEGDFFLEIDLDASNRVTIVIPDEHDMGLTSYEDIEVNVKTTKTRKRKATTVKAAKTAEAEVATSELEYAIEEPAAQISEITEEEQALLESWREIHESNGRTSSNPIDWFADYTLSVLQEGREIPDAAFALAAKLANRAVA